MEEDPRLGGCTRLVWKMSVSCCPNTIYFSPITQLERLQQSVKRISRGGSICPTWISELTFPGFPKVRCEDYNLAIKHCQLRLESREEASQR